MADALSRQSVFALEEDASSDLATIHSEESLTYTIDSSDKPINCFRNQIILEENAVTSARTIIMFGQKTRHIIHFNDKQQLMELVFDAVNKDVVNAIACELPILAFVQNKLVETFPSTKFWHTKRMVIDVLDKNEQKEIIIAEHNRAHRAAQENVKQIMRLLFFRK